MDNLFADNDYFNDGDGDFDSPYSLRSNRRFLQDDDPDFGLDRVYLIPFRWWIEAQCEGDRVEGVLYTVSCYSDSEDEILLDLRKEEEDREKIKRLELGFSGRQYALVPEGSWLRVLKRTNCTVCIAIDVLPCPCHKCDSRMLSSIHKAQTCHPRLCLLC